MRQAVGNGQVPSVRASEDGNPLEPSGRRGSDQQKNVFRRHGGIISRMSEKRNHKRVDYNVEVKAKPERCSEQNRNAKKVLKTWVKVRENSF